jgi:hypothetical protein
MELYESYTDNKSFRIEIKPYDVEEIAIGLTLSLVDHGDKISLFISKWMECLRKSLE